MASGQDDTLGQLLRYRRELFGFIRAIVRNSHDAEDLFQEVARIIVEKAGAGAVGTTAVSARPGPAGTTAVSGRRGEQVRDFRAWSKEIARRRVLQHFREARARRAVALPVEEMAEVVADAYLRHSPEREDLESEYEAVRLCLGAARDETVHMIRLRFSLDMAYRDIARRLRKTETAARRAVARARLKITECVRRRLGAAT